MARDRQVSKIHIRGGSIGGEDQYNQGIEWREAARSVKFLSGADPSGFGSIQRGDRMARDRQVSKIPIRGGSIRCGGRYNERIWWRETARSVEFVSGADPSGVRDNITWKGGESGVGGGQICG